LLAFESLLFSHLLLPEPLAFQISSFGTILVRAFSALERPTDPDHRHPCGVVLFVAVADFT
jgi:hypothetical protein